MKPIPKILFPIFIFFITSVVQSQEIPADLKQWQGWVEYKQESMDCPFFYNQKNTSKSSHVCAWPQTLNLNIEQKSGSFDIKWDLIQDSWVSLPGDKHSWPRNVRVDQKTQMIQRNQGHPRIFLKKGSYQISGDFKWSKRPENIDIPQEIAAINLNIDQKIINFPQRKGMSLWLGENKSTDKQESNKVEFDVNRLIIDGHPMTMYVLIDLSVSGNARNENLGKITSQQLQVTNIGGEISTYIDKQGFLWAQLKPGNWQIHVSFNVIGWPNQISFNPQGEHWPQQEIWAYQDDKNIRITQIKGAQPINPEQAFSEWDEVPNYLLNAGDKFEIIEQKRGTLNQTAQLNLYRTMWMSFDGQSIRSNDEVIGDKLGSWRLDAVNGYQLLNALNHEDNMLITKSIDGNQGLELRTPEIDLKINAEFSPELLNQINPWQTSFNRIQTKMFLPYGYLPLVTTNVDSSHGIWLEKWKLWDIFIVMLMTVFCFKVLGIRTAVVAFVTLVLGYHESNMPLIAWANIIIGVALLSIKPNGRILQMIRTYVVVSVFALLMVLVPFIITQVRLAIHPQLENSLTSLVSNFSSVKKAKRESQAKNRYEEMSRQNTQSYNTMNAIAQKQSPASFEMEEDKVELERVVTVGSRIRNQDLINRYQTGAVLQAGKATPQWRTNQISLNWEGPINENQQFNIIILPPFVRVIWRLLLVLASVAWLVFLIKKLTTGFIKPKVKSSATALLLLLLTPITINAQSFPSEARLAELQKRIYPEVECKSNCASIDSSHISVTAKELTIELSYHAFENVAVDIPFSNDWHIDKIIVNGKLQSNRLLYKNKPWIQLTKGMNLVELSGAIANRNNISIHYPSTPGNITTESNGWQIAGIDNNLLTNNTLQLISTIQDSVDSEQIKSTDINPYVRVERHLTFDDNWDLYTTIERLAPHQGALNLSIPLLENEHPTDKLQLDEKGHVIVSIGPTETSYRWNSRLDKSEEITLLAEKSEQYLEVWKILSSPQWNILLSGVPIITPLDIVDNMDDYFIHTYKPRPGESLNIKVSRPQALEGDIVSIESINNTYSVGKRATKSITTIYYRATQGGSFDIQLDESAVINSVTYDGVNSNLTNEKGLISVGFLPGAHKVVIDWQVDTAFGTINTTPKISLESQYANIYQSIKIAKNRWVLYGYSQGVGPAFLYWGEFLFFTVLAFFLARLPYSILKFWQWLVLGYAFGTVSWFAFGFITLWLFFVGWKKQYVAADKNYKTILLQWFTLIFTFFTLVVFIGSVAFGLLSYPQMGIMGQNSSASHLNWFLDVYQGQLPSITILSLPIWWYKGLMLIWSIWVSFSLLNWLKQLLNSLDKNHWWGRSKIKKAVKDD